MIAKRLDDLGVDVIEAGSAISSEGEVKALRMIMKEGLNAEICSFARALKSDLDAVLKSDVDGIHLVIPTSKIHLEHKLRKTEEEILDMTTECVEYSKAHGLIVELSAEDSTRSDINFLKKVFSRGISSGADRICACDTVGILTPERSYAFYTDLKSSFKTLLSVHCHNDFGLAVANSIEALRAGVDQVHTTINGIGERAGNASLEEVVMTLRLLYNINLPIRTELLYDTSRMVSRLTGIIVQPNKAIVGENAFSTQAGIHTHGILASPTTYEAIPPELVGISRKFEVGKLAGLHGIRAIIKDMGLNANDEQLKEVYQIVKKMGDFQRLTDVNLYRITEEVMGLPQAQSIKLEQLTVVTGNTVTPTASVRLIVEGETINKSGIGIGPVDAAINAIREAASQLGDIRLDQYYVKAISGGSDAVVEVIVRLRRGSKIITSLGVHGDIVMASVKAMLEGMNLLLLIPEKK